MKRFCYYRRNVYYYNTMEWFHQLHSDIVTPQISVEALLSFEMIIKKILFFRTASKTASKLQTGETYPKYSFAIKVATRTLDWLEW